MAGFTRTKNYADGDILAAADYTGELDNIINNLYPAMLDDESANVAAQQATTNPASALPTTLQGELQGLRYIIKALSLQPYWYTAPTTSAFSVHKNASDQVITTTTWTQVTFGTEVFDANSNFATNAFTPTIAGQYLLNAQVAYSAGESGKSYLLAIYKNGTAYCLTQAQASATDAISINVSVVASANGSTDVFTVYTYHNATAGTINGGTAYSFFTGHKVSP